MPDKVAKAFAINDAKILFVSLVDKAANQKEFLITKSENGQAVFRTYGRILKSNEKAHYVTGIVYEPMVEDSQGNYMTAEEIEKSAHWFAKNGSSVDLQHSFKPLEGAAVVESWIAKADFEIDGEPVKKGTWLMTMEISNPDIFAAIEKGEITGFSMGGSGVYSETDVDITDPENPVAKGAEDTPEVASLKQRIAKFLGFNTVAKGKVMDDYKRNSIRDNFWTAYYALSEYLLDAWNPETGRWDIQTDETIIRDALDDFNQIVTELLSQNEPVIKTLNAVPVEKAGKAISDANKATLKGIHESLGEFLAKFEEEEEVELTKSELESIVAGAVQKAMSGTGQSTENTPQTTEGTLNIAAGVQKDVGGCGEATQGLTLEAIEKMVAEAVQKAAQPKEEPLTMEAVQKCIDAAVQKAMEPVLKSTGIPTNLNNESVQKEAGGEQHFMHGFF